MSLIFLSRYILATFFVFSLTVLVEICMPFRSVVFIEIEVIFALFNRTENMNRNLIYYGKLHDDIPQLIADSYERYHFSVYLYIYNKVNNKEEAEDLSQDVFVRLMDYKRMLRPDTVKFFIYTISRNLVNDYLRRYYKKQEITSYMYDRTEVSHNEVESCVVADDLLACEKRRVEFLPSQRRKIYVMNRFEDKSVTDISEELNLSRRTVENHLFISRKEVREYLKQCI